MTEFGEGFDTVEVQTALGEEVVDTADLDFWRELLKEFCVFVY
jgi:hypothetical protein